MYNSDNINVIAVCVVKVSSLTESNRPGRPQSRVIIAGKNVAPKDSILTVLRRSYPLRVAITTRIPWFEPRWLLSIDAAMRLPASVQSVLRFIVGGTKARHDGRAYKCRRRWRRVDVKIVIFDFRPYFFDVGDKPPRYRRVRGKSDETRTTSGLAGRRAEGSIRIHHCGILNSFFCVDRCLRTRLRPAVVIRKCIQVCKDRALKRRASECMSFRIDQGAMCAIRFALLLPRMASGNSKLRNGYTQTHTQRDRVHWVF